MIPNWSRLWKWIVNFEKFAWKPSWQFLVLGSIGRNCYKPKVSSFILLIFWDSWRIIDPSIFFSDVKACFHYGLFPRGYYIRKHFSYVLSLQFLLNTLKFCFKFPPNFEQSNLVTNCVTKTNLESLVCTPTLNVFRYSENKKVLLIYLIYYFLLLFRQIVILFLSVSYQKCPSDSLKSWSILKVRQL